MRRASYAPPAVFPSRRRCSLELAAFGNLLAATAFLHGVSVEELQGAELEPLDTDFLSSWPGMAVKARP